MLKQPWLALSFLPLLASNIGSIGCHKLCSKKVLYSTEYRMRRSLQEKGWDGPSSRLVLSSVDLYVINKHCFIGPNSMESIESSTHNLSLSPLSALNLPADSAKFSSAKKLQKISSADSLFTMIKNLASNRSCF